MTSSTSSKVSSCLAAAGLLAALMMVPSAHAGSEATSAAVRERLTSPVNNNARSVDSVSVPEWKALGRFYGEREYQPAWTGNEEQFESLSRGLLAVLDGAGKHGLSPETYHAGLIDRLADSPGDERAASRQADIELLFSGALLAYARDLLNGRARRVELKDSSFNVDENVDVVEAVSAALADGNLRALISTVSPVAKSYAELRDALSRLRARQANERRFDLREETLHPGDDGAEVASLRRRLAFLGDLPALHDDNLGVFDGPLTEAVKRFQARHGLETDGVVGRETRDALEVPLSRRIEQIELSLERWRWLPRDPGERYLVVNIGGQELDVMESGRSSLNMRVIVGLPFMRTPSFASELRTVVLNPYWEVPHSIAVREILPKLREDALYLSREHMQVLKRGTNELVNPIPIDWQSVSSRDFPYRFRQKPGPDNALGRVKFLMPNSYNVYLHDTPAKTLFSRARRCFSHGCVRLEKPLELADLVLHDEPGWSFERVRKTLETEQDYRISLTRHMPVYLVYWTAWVDNTGIVNFRDDVYGRDERLIEALATL